MKKIVFKKIEKFWDIESYNNEKLLEVADLLVERQDFLLKLKNQLMVNSSKSTQGYRNKVEIKNDKAYILPTYEDFPEDHPTILDKDLLLQLVNEWQSAIAQNPDEIILQQDDAGQMSISPIFLKK